MKLSDCTLVYLGTANVAHVLPPGQSPNEGPGRAACNRTPDWLVPWMGTGSQDEYDRAATLPLCVSCRQALARTTLREGHR